MQLMGLGTTITSEPFLVLRRLDIRDDAALQKSVRVNLSRRVVDKFLILCGGAIDALFTVEKTGHLPGDDIVIDGEVENNSRQMIKLIQVSLFPGENALNVRETEQNAQRLSHRCAFGTFERQIPHAAYRTLRTAMLEW